MLQNSLLDWSKQTMLQLYCTYTVHKMTHLFASNIVMKLDMDYPKLWEPNVRDF